MHHIFQAITCGLHVDFSAFEAAASKYSGTSNVTTSFILTSAFGKKIWLPNHQKCRTLKASSWFQTHMQVFQVDKFWKFLVPLEWSSICWTEFWVHVKIDMSGCHALCQANFHFLFWPRCQYFYHQLIVSFKLTVHLKDRKQSVWITA